MCLLLNICFQSLLRCEELLMKVDCFQSEIPQRVIEFAKVDVSSLLKVFVSILF